MEKKGFSIGAKTYLATVSILLAILLAAGILTQVIPQGSFEREIVDGREVILADSYAETPDAPRLPVWRWFTAPFEVLAGEDGVTAIMIMVFLLLIGGTFLVLNESGILQCMLSAVIRRYAARKYVMLRVVVLICMLIGSVMGIFEEAVPLAPILVALALSLGWDSLVGLGMSVAAFGFGFAAGTLNPFTVGIPQSLAGLPAFSGLLFRIAVFAVVYLLFTGFLVRYAKKVEAAPETSLVADVDGKLRERFAFDGGGAEEPACRRGCALFLGAIGLVFLYILVGLFVPGLSDYSMPVMAVMFAAGGLAAGRAAGMKKGLWKSFGSGMLSIAPSLLLILLALSAKQIFYAGGIMDTVLYHSYSMIQGSNPYVSVALLFGFILVLQFFIAGASAKAFLVMPLVVPLVDMIGLTRQTAVQAFIFGDGFTNLIFPTNPVLLISLGLISISYGRWFKWIWKVQLALFVLSVLALWAAVALGYGPF